MRIGSLMEICFLTDGIGGKSSIDGFVIETKAKTVKSRTYTVKKEKVKTKIRYLVVWALSWLIYFFLLSLVWMANENTWQLIISEIIVFIMSGVFSVILIHILFFREIFGKDTAEYHAAEHMTICLIREGYEPTIENLKKMPRSTFWCGTTFLGIFAYSPLLIGVAYALGKITPENFIGFIVFVLLIIFWTILVAPIITQFFFTTKFPSEEKLKEALEVINELV